MRLKARLVVIQRPLAVIQRPLAVIQRPTAVIQRPTAVIHRPLNFTTNLLFGSFHVILPFDSRADSKSPLSFASSGHPEFAISVEVSTIKDKFTTAQYRCQGCPFEHIDSS